MDWVLALLICKILMSVVIGLNVVMIGVMIWAIVTKQYERYQPKVRPYVFQATLKRDQIEDQGVYLTTQWCYYGRTISDPDMDQDVPNSGMSVSITGWDERADKSFDRITEFLDQEVRVTVEVIPSGK